MSEALIPTPCQVGSKTESPCHGRAIVEIQGVAFCGPCAHEQEAYFLIGELTQGEKNGSRSKALAKALKTIRRRRTGSREDIAA